MSTPIRFEGTRLARAMDTDTHRTSPRASADAPSLLPAPQNLATEDVADAAAQLYAFVCKRRHAQANAAEAELSAAGKQAQAARERERAALAKAKAHRPKSGPGLFKCLKRLVVDMADDMIHLRAKGFVENLGKNAKAAGDSPKFWDELKSCAMFVGKAAAVVAAAAATVATFGAAGPVAVLVIAGVCLSGAGMVQSEFHVLEKLGVDADVANKIGFGLSIGGAVCMGAGGIANAGSAATTSASWVTKGANAIAVGGSVVSGGAQIVGGAATIRSADFTAVAEHSTADAVGERQRAARFDQMVTLLIEGLEETNASNDRALEGLSQAIGTRNETLVLSTMRA